jgi:hypothetical protein
MEALKIIGALCLAIPVILIAIGIVIGVCLCKVDE